MEPRKLIASGRDPDIFELGPELVLRRTRAGRSLEAEAHVMQYVHQHGYPVPVVHELRAGGTEIVMDRIDGPIMMDAMLKRLWTLPTAAATLADLHDRLHAIAAPDWMRQLRDGGNQIVHLDLHPLNVILNPKRGPVVIDWANASRGDGLFDVAATYVLLTCPRVPGPAWLRAAAWPIRTAFVRSFARRYRGRELDARIADAADFKALDDAMQPDEIAAMQRLASRMRKRAEKRMIRSRENRERA